MTQKQEKKKKELLDRLFRQAFMIQTSINFMELGGETASPIDNIEGDIAELTNGINELKEFCKHYQFLN